VTTPRTLLVNAGSNVSVMVVKLCLAFIMTPVLVHNIGRYDFGLWEMLGSVVGYMGMLDLGLRPTLSRFAAHHKAKGSRRDLELTFSTGVLFLGAIGILLCGVLIAWGLLLPETLAETPGRETTRYAALLLIIGIEVAVTFPGAVAESYLEGFQTYYVKNNITIVNSIVSAAVVYCVITPTNGLVVLALGNGIGHIVKIAMFFWLLQRPAFGGVRFWPGDFSWPVLRELFVFGSKSFVQGISTRTEYAADSLVIGAFLGPAVVPLYTIPANLVGYLRIFGYNITHAFMPLFSELNAREDHNRALRTYLAASRLAVGLIVPAGVGMCLLGGPFIRLWMGADFGRDADLILVLLVLFTLVPALNPLSSRYLTAIGEHGIFARLAPVSASMNLALSAVLVIPLGIAGVALGSVVPAVTLVGVYLKRCCLHLGTTAGKYMREAVAPCIVPTMVMAVTVLAIRTRIGLGSYPRLALALLVGGAVYLLAFWRLGLAREERRVVLGRIRAWRGALEWRKRVSVQ